MIHLALLLISSLHAAGLTTSQVEEKANQFYDQGNCEKAIKAYALLLKASSATQAQKDLSNYRSAYCHYTLGNLEESAEGFKKILSKYPQQDEARLRYAEVLAEQGEYEESINQALQVKEPSLQDNARLLLAKNFLQTKQSEQALQKLDELPKKNPEWQPVVEYWKGVAYYQLFDERAAERSFTNSINTSNEKLWTKSASENWLRNLKESQRWFHARFSGTWGNDTNLGQVTYKSAKNGTPDPVYYVKDHYKAAEIEFSTKEFRTGKMSWTPSFSAYGLFYSYTNRSYNPMYLTAQVAHSVPWNHRWTQRSTLAYTDSRYNLRYYQDYLSFNTTAIYGVSSRTTAHFGLGLTPQVVTRPGLSLGPNVGFESDLAWFYWFGSASLTVASGEQATYTSSSGVYSVNKGVAFSNYTATALKLGIGKVLPWGFDLNLQAGLTKTSYKKENAPASASFETDARRDTAVVYQANLSRPLIEKRLTATASYIYTKNVSQGFQGTLYSGGSSSDYNYYRKQAQITLAFGF